MHLAAGRSFLHYRLVEKIGEGGMGVVWRAVESLREAAIKVLPAVVAGDPERLARLERGHPQHLRRPPDGKSLILVRAVEEDAPTIFVRTAWRPRR